MRAAIYVTVLVVLLAACSVDAAANVSCTVAGDAPQPLCECPASVGADTCLCKTGYDCNCFNSGTCLCQTGGGCYCASSVATCSCTGTSQCVTQSYSSSLSMAVGRTPCPSRISLFFFLYGLALAVYAGLIYIFVKPLQRANLRDINTRQAEVKQWFNPNKGGGMVPFTRSPHPSQHMVLRLFFVFIFCSSSLGLVLARPCSLYPYTAFMFCGMISFVTLYPAHYMIFDPVSGEARKTTRSVCGKKEYVAYRYSLNEISALSIKNGYDLYASFPKPGTPDVCLWEGVRPSRNSRGDYKLLDEANEWFVKYHSSGPSLPPPTGAPAAAVPPPGVMYAPAAVNPAYPGQPAGTAPSQVVYVVAPAGSAAPPPVYTPGAPVYYAAPAPGPAEMQRAPPQPYVPVAGAAPPPAYGAPPPAYGAPPPAAAPGAVVMPAVRFCPTCGTEQRPTATPARFCLACGSDLFQPAARQ